MRPFTRRLLTILGIIVVVIIVLVAAGSVYEAVARRNDLAQHAAPGRLVDVEGHQLHIVCLGEDDAETPVVVLESGVGGWSMHWHDVQNKIATFARVCAYDRAGMGWSEAGPTPRDGQQVVNELHTLLQNAGEAPPYVMVGASRGGQYVRLYAATYAGEVSGMVLVDAEPEEMRVRSAFARNAAAQNQGIFSALGMAGRMGIFRLLGNSGGAQNGASGEDSGIPAMPCLPWATRHLPVELHEHYVAVEGQPRCFQTVVDEEAASDAREAQVRAAGTLGDTPLIVLTHGASAVPPNATLEGAAEYEEVWQELQQEIAALSSNSLLIVAEESGHDIQFDQPQLIVESVRRVIDVNFGE